MTLVYLVRHAETDWNAEGKLCGSSDIPLSEQGLKQAKLLSERLSSVPFSAIYTSPLLRAFQTAEIISSTHKLHPIVDPDLCEIDYGDWEGFPVQELLERFPDLEQTRTQDPLRFVAPDGEEFSQFAERVINAIKRIAHLHADETICIISHQGVSRTFLCQLLQSDFSLWRRLRQDPTCVNIFQIRNTGEWKILLVNDTCHLKNLR